MRNFGLVGCDDCQQFEHRLQLNRLSKANRPVKHVGRSQRAGASMKEYGLIIFVTSLTTASVDFHRRGWLDRVVAYHKNKLLEDFRKVPNVEIKATIEPAPEGYVDSPAWDYDSVTRLLILIRESRQALPVQRALRRMFANSRRQMTFQETFKFFPKIEVKNDLYYDTYSGELEGEVMEQVENITNDTDDNGVIMVSNPVEARLPSAMISVNLLRDILEQRAQAARYMPTTRRTISWKPMTKSSQTAAEGNTTQTGDGATGTGNTDANGGNTGNTGATGGTGTGGAEAAATTVAAAK